MYNSEIANESYKDTSRLTAGIHDNMTLSNIESKTSPNGNKMLEFTFSKDDSEIKITEWEPKDGQYQTAIEGAKKQYKKVQQILLAFFPGKDKLQFIGANFDEFANWVLNTYATVDKSTKLRVKFVYDNKGYIIIPKNGYYTHFIEPMSIVTEGNGKVVKLDKDVFVKPIIEDEETSNPNPLTIVDGTLSTTVNDDLPF